MLLQLPPRRFFLILTGVVAALFLAVGQVPAQEADTDSDESEVTEAAPTMDVEVLGPIEDKVTIHGEESGIEYRLATVEQDLFLAHRALSAREQAKAKQLFNGAFSSLLNTRKEYLKPGSPEPMVRDFNFARGRYSDNRSGETWRPLTDYLNLWFAQFPREYHRKLQSRWGVKAGAALRQALESNNELALRDVARRYFYADAGLEALDAICDGAFERGDFLDLTAWLVLLKETRPEVYRANPTRHLRLLLALEVLDEFDLLTDERETAALEFDSATLTVGDAGLGFNEALELLRAEMGLKSREDGEPELLVAGKLGAPTILPLGSASEFLNDVVEIPMSRYNNPFGPWNVDDGTELFLPEAIPFNGGLIAPRDANSFFWYPTLDPTAFRRLSLSADEVYQRSLVKMVPEDRHRNRRFTQSRVSPVSMRLRSCTVARQTRVWKKGMTVGHRDILVATMGSAKGSTGLLRENSGNLIQLFDLTREGVLLYSLPRSDEGNDEFRKKLSMAHFGGRPMVLGNRLYVIGSMGVTNSSEVHVFCFDIAPESKKPGKLLWTTKLSAVKNRSSGWASITDLIEASTLTVSGNRILANTNCGTAFSIDARDGHPYWAVKYELRPRVTFDPWGWGWARTQKSVSLGVDTFPTSTSLYGATAVIAPSDGKTSLALNAYDGYVLKPLLKQNRAFETSNFLIGVAGGYAYFSTESGLQAEAVTYNSLVRGPDGNYSYGKPLKESGLPDQYSGDVIAGRARGLIVGSEILLPGTNGLLRFDRFTLAYKNFQRWPDLPPEEKEKDDEEEGKTEESETRDRLDIPGLISLSYLPEGSGPGGKAALVRVDARNVKVYPLEP